MSKLFVKLIQFLVAIYSISSDIIINSTTQSMYDSDYFRIQIKENVSNMDAEAKVNNKKVEPFYNGSYLIIECEPGDIEIIIHTNLTSLKDMFSDSKAVTIKIRTSGTHVTDLEGLFNNQNILRKVDLSEFDISKVTSFVKMFYNCKELVDVKFGNFQTSCATNMKYMFYYCQSLSSLDLSAFDTSQVTDMSSLFYYCYNLEELNLKNFVVTKVKNFFEMFYNCESLISLDLSNFVVLEANDTSYMFYGCGSLISLDLNSFITSNATSMDSMFYECNSLISLDLSGFNTSNVTSMNSMFYGCNSLKYINIDHFDTSSVKDMSYMFYDCRFLTSLNIRNFKGNSVLTTEEMFSGCYSLSFLDFNNFKPTKIENLKKMFYSCIDLKSLDLNNFDTSLTTDMEYMFYGCKSLIYLNINNFKINNNSNLGSMFRGCSSLTSLNLSNFKISENTRFEDIFFDISENLIYCVNDEFYEKIKSDMNKNKCATRGNCIPNWHKKSRKLIYDNSGPCVEYCNETEKFKYEYESKCYPSCPEGTTSLYNDNFLCEIFNDIKYKLFLNKTNNYDQIQDINTNELTGITKIAETTKNIKDITTSINYNTNDINNIDTSEICKANYFFENKCRPKKYKNMIEIIKEGIIDGVMNDEIDNIIRNNIDYYKIDDNIKYQITSSFNQNNNIYDNISSIKLKECESTLKNVNNIPQNDTLIIFKYDYITDKAFIPIVGYEVFNPITKDILDLNVCKNITIDVYLSTNISDNEIYKHDPNNNYYKDKCYSYPNEKGLDMTIYDRKKEYNDKNLALCPENCNYINYNNETKKVLCECEPQFNSSLVTLDKIINGKKLLHNFRDIKKTLNMGVIKCYKKLMSLSGLKNNIGSYILLSIIIIYIIGLITFLIKGYKLLSSKIEKIIIDSKKQNESNNFIINYPPIKRNIALNIKMKNNQKKSKNKNLINNNTSTNNFNSRKNNKSLSLENNKEDKNEKDKIDIKYNDTELNIYEYSIAQKNDKRGYIQCYISLLKTRHPLLSSFIPNNDYNSMSIKICLFFFSFALNFFVNALFFTDETMHKIIEDEGVFNFVYNLPKTIYSTIISFTINFIIKKLALSENTILSIRRKKNLNDIEQSAKKMKTNLIIKFILFFTISFILLLTFWYYIGCFCVVYTNTQIYLIKETLISFTLSLIIPFLIYLFVCFIRIKSLNKPGECLYNISQILQ